MYNKKDNNEVVDFAANIRIIQSSAGHECVQVFIVKISAKHFNG